MEPINNECKIEHQSRCAAITDWTTVELNITDHRGKYLRRVSVYNRNSEVTTGDRTSVGCVLIQRRAGSGLTVLDTLTDNNLFGYHEGLTWEGSVYIDDAMILEIRYVAAAVGDIINIQAVISEEPGANYAMPKPRERLIQTTTSFSTGAGGTVSATLTVPVGRRWKIVSAYTANNDNAKVGIIGTYDASAVLINYLMIRSSCTTDYQYQYPPGNGVAADYTPTNSINHWTYLRERNTLKFILVSSTASKTVLYSYTIIEEPDTQIPAPT